MQPDRPPTLVRADVPVLPPMALQQGIGGVVAVRVTLDATGAVRDVAVTRTPSRVLDRESLRAARASTFAPARRRCVSVASAYEFRVLYDPNRQREPLPPTPSPSPSPTPLAAPDLTRPWTLVWSTGGSFSDTKRTLRSSRSYVRVDTFTIERRKECGATLSAAELERVTAALRASAPEGWQPSYQFGAPPTPSPSPAPAPTSTPAVDAVAVVRGEIGMHRTVDGGSSDLMLVSGARSYRTSFEYGWSWPPTPPISAELQDVTRAFAAADAGCRPKKIPLA
jgi:TonB family protein